MKVLGFPTRVLQKTLTKIGLKNIDYLSQKYQERQFRSFTTNDSKTAIMIANIYRDGNGTFAYASHTTKEVINIDTCDLKDANLRTIMPECYKQLHNHMVARFFVKQDNIDQKNKNFLVYTIDPNSFMRLSVAYMKIFPYVQSNIRHVN
jgi:hypothetical protein